jgi:hypothetical protein
MEEKKKGGSKKERKEGRMKGWLEEIKEGIKRVVKVRRKGGRQEREEKSRKNEGTEG